MSIDLSLPEWKPILDIVNPTRAAEGKELLKVGRRLRPEEQQALWRIKGIVDGESASAVGKATEALKKAPVSKWSAIGAHIGRNKKFYGYTALATSALTLAYTKKMLSNRSLRAQARYAQAAGPRSIKYPGAIGAGIGLAAAAPLLALALRRKKSNLDNQTME